MDHLGLPMREGVNFVHNALVGINARDCIKVGASGKIATAFDMARAMAIGADWCNSARGFMFALGCIQSQSCHTGHCPTGVATQDPQRARALVVPTKADRVFNFHDSTLHALKELIQAAGLNDPSELTANHIVRRNSEGAVKLLANLLPFAKPGELLRGESTQQVFRMYWPMAQASSFGVVR
jgi:glutamate synthase domain-containing protein 2